MPPAAAEIEDQPETPEPAAAAAPPPVSEAQTGQIDPPHGGVEIIGTEQRNNIQYHILRDLRNGNIVKNVTRSSARRLWHYAISQTESNPVKADKVQWQGDIGVWRRYQKAGETRYDLAQRDNGGIRVYYGVTEGGMHGPWLTFLGPDDEE